MSEKQTTIFLWSIKQTNKQQIYLNQICNLLCESPYRFPTVPNWWAILRVVCIGKKSLFTYTYLLLIYNLFEFFRFPFNFDFDFLIRFDLIWIHLCFNLIIVQFILFSGFGFGFWFWMLSFLLYVCDLVCFSCFNQSIGLVLAIFF